MKIITFTTGLLMACATFAASGADDTNAVPREDSTSPTYDRMASQLYSSNEASLDVFGYDALGQHTISHPSGDRIRHSSRLGLGAGANYFFTRYIGLGADAYSGDTRHNFVDNVSGSLILRAPLGETGLAPYVFGGGGHQFDPEVASFVHAGGGLEFRFTRHVGTFVDARYVWTDRSRNYGLGRAGIRISF